MDAEVVDDARHNGVLAAPVAKDVPGDLRRTPDEEVEAPDVLAVVARRGREDGAPPKREAPEPKNLRARSPVVRPPTAGRANPGDHGPQHLEAIARGQFLVGLPFKAMQKPFRGTEDTCTVNGTGHMSTIQRRQRSQ